MPATLGANCKIYRNTGTYAAPVWAEITIVKDVTLNLEANEADTTTRAADGWQTAIAALKAGSVDFGVIWDTADIQFEALRTAFFDGTLVDLAVMDGDIAVAGRTGLRAEMAVLSFTRNEQLQEAVTASVKCKPGFSTNAPVWMVVP